MMSWNLDNGCISGAILCMYEINLLLLRRQFPAMRAWWFFCTLVLASGYTGSKGGTSVQQLQTSNSRQSYISLKVMCMIHGLANYLTRWKLSFQNSKMTLLKTVPSRILTFNRGLVFFYEIKFPPKFGFHFLCRSSCTQRRIQNHLHCPDAIHKIVAAGNSERINQVARCGCCIEIPTILHSQTRNYSRYQWVSFIQAEMKKRLRSATALARVLKIFEV
jgi:hypothetical protein